MEELILYRDAIKKYQEDTTHEFYYFWKFIENSGLYSQQEKKLILESHFDFSWNSREKNYYFEEISKIDFRGGYSEKTRDDEKMFADLFNGKKLRI
nr:hypothetical protein [Mesomycoplasma ovipneumoniae]